MALGVGDLRKVQEFGRSTGKQDRDEAAKAYRAMLDGWDAKLEAWRVLLEAGPTSLTYKQQIALAADHAKAFLAAHEDEPFEAPPPPSIQPPEPGLGALPEADNAAWRAAVQCMTPEEREALRLDLLEFLRANDARRSKPAFRLLQKHPAFAAVNGPDLAGWLEAMHGADTEAALEARGLHVDAVTRRLINLEMAGFMGAAQRGLEARRGGDYGPVKELEAAPAYVAPAASPAPAAVGGGLSLEYLLDHKAKTTSIRPKTVSDNRTYLKKFAEFLGHDDARRVTKDDVRRWRDGLIETGLSPKTITDKYLSAVRAVLAHGHKEFSLPFNAASGLADNRAGKDPERREWTEVEAVQILKATFGGSSKALSGPHRRAVFWMPWIAAYTGLRAAEIGQFQGRHLREENGIPYLLITPADGSTKSGKAWAVGIHKHLIELGLLDCIREVGKGPLFYEPYPSGTDLRELGVKHRGTETSKRVGKWITGEVGLKAPLGRPLHAFRHLFTTRSRACGMDKEARDFMMGSGPADAREGYGDWPSAVLDREICSASTSSTSLVVLMPMVRHTGSPKESRTGGRVSEYPGMDLNMVSRKPRASLGGWRSSGGILPVHLLGGSAEDVGIKGPDGGGAVGHFHCVMLLHGRR